MVEKKKIVAFPKDLMSEVVYGAESSANGMEEKWYNTI